MYKIQNTRNIDHTVDCVIPQINVAVTFDAPKRTGYRIKSSNDAYNLLRQTWDHRTINWTESMYMICLDNSNNVLGIYLVSTGGYTATLVDVKAIMLVAINTCCTGVIIAHNHPSGSIHPSSSDKYITTKVNNALNMVDIKLLDHMIITDEAYYSFADENIL